MPRPEVEFAAKLVERYAATKIPPEVQDEIRLEVETVGNSITIWECHDLRSINARIEYLLAEQARKARRWPPTRHGARRKQNTAT